VATAIPPRAVLDAVFGASFEVGGTDADLAREDRPF
jgi:hypothetical protein